MGRTRLTEYWTARILLATCVSLMLACGGGGSSPSAPTTTADALGSFTLRAEEFTAPNTVFSSSADRVTYIEGYEGASSGGLVYVITSTVFVRDDGATYLATCGGGSLGSHGGGGGGGYRNTQLGFIYAFGKGHTLDATIIGALFTTDPFGPGGDGHCPFGTFSPTGTTINWPLATARLDVPLHWTIQ